MAINLLDLAKSYLSDSVVSQVGTMLGENQEHTQKALDGAFPVILSGLIQKSSETGGATSIMNMINEVAAPNQSIGDGNITGQGILGQLGGLLSSTNQSGSLLSTGLGIIQRLFGDRADAIASSVATYSGVKQSSASSLLSLAAPILVSVLGKKMADGNTGVSGLGSLLSSQTGAVQSALPAGLGALLGGIPGMGMLAGLASSVKNVTTGVRESVTPSVTPSAAPTFATDDERSGSSNRWLPWLLLVLGAAALLYFLRSCSKDKEVATNATENVQAMADSTVSGLSSAADSAGNTLGAAMDSAGSAVNSAASALGSIFTLKLPSGLELNVPENGIESKLVTFIEDKGKVVDKTTWFNFDRLLFETGKATLKPESKEEVKNIAEILKAFPSVNIKIGGYTDNTGSADLNKKLSQERADAVMAELIQLGIDKGRLAAEGYGPEHPVASNDTEAGRTQNRRIAVRVTKK